jgi:hypothetical protein
MLFRFRDKAYAAHGFGTHVVYALRRSAFRTTVHQPRGCQFAGVSSKPRRGNLTLVNSA